MLPKRSEKGKEEAKERDRERKREKRSQLTTDQYDQARLLDRERWHKKRKNMSLLLLLLFGVFECTSRSTFTLIVAVTMSISIDEFK